MYLGNIQRGTKLNINEELHEDSEIIFDEYEAVFHYLESDVLFLIKSVEMFENFGRINREARMSITFKNGPIDCIFLAMVKEKRGNSDILLLEQVSEIEENSRRKHARDEHHFDIRVFGMPEEKLKDPANYKISNLPDMIDMTFDISTGGLCVITNRMLKSEHDPFYLLEVTLSEKHVFRLPAKLVRISRNPRSKIGKLEYSFQYLAEMPAEEKSQLASAILQMKLPVK